MIKRIEETGRAIQKRYCRKTPATPAMFPPIPNCSKYIDQFPEEGLNSKNKADKDRQEDYAAEVTVYRALENLQEEIVVLHSLDYTNRQLKLFKKDFSFDGSKPNKVAGECDFVVVGENCVIIIEVSDVKRDEGKNTDKKLKKTFNGKKKQGERTKDLIENMLKYIDSKGDEAVQSPFIKWYCAFLSLSSDCEHIFTEEQRSNIIFSDSFGSFQEWWKENVTVKTTGISVSEMKITALTNLLLGLWNIDTQNQINVAGRCSFGSNIMKVDSQLKNAQITYGFRKPEDPEYNNPDLVEADDVFQGMGIKFLSKEQDLIFQSTEKFLWVNGPAGSGKTMLILGKAIKTAQAEEGKVVIFKNMSEERSRKMYQGSLHDSGIKYVSIDANIEDPLLHSTDVDKKACDFARRICHALTSCDVALFELCTVYQVTRNFGGLQMINKIITSVVQQLRSEDSQKPLACFIDDEHCLLVDRLYDRVKSIEQFTQITAETSNNCSIWIFTDIAQSSDHMAPDNVHSLIPDTESMVQTYGPLTLSKNFRNTYDIACLLEQIRETIVFSSMQLLGHFIRGPKPVIQFVKAPELRSRRHVIEFVEGEIEKVIDSKDINSTDIGLIYNSEHAVSLLAKIFRRKNESLGPVCNIADVYSAEWPVTLFLMDLTDVQDQHHTISHQLYLALSRARVYCSVMIYSYCSYTEHTHLESLLEKLEQYARVRQIISIEGLVLPEIGDQDDFPLHCAVRDGDLDLAKRLISNGESVNERNGNGLTPLYYTSHRIDLDVLRYLIESGANVNDRNKKGLTPLHYAVRHRNLQNVQLLVESGAEILIKDDEGLSPLYYAVQQESVDMVSYLVASAANSTKYSKEWLTPLHQAVIQGEYEVVRYLVEFAAENNYDIGSSSPLFCIQLNENLDIVRYLAESGVDVNNGTSDGFTPLQEAVLKENIDIVRYLVESGAAVNNRTRDGLTPLQEAVQKKNIDIVRYLVESGADVNNRDNKGLTPLHYAVQKKNIDIVRYLVESGAAVNNRTRDGLTPLQEAVQKKNIDIVRYLVESGADVNNRDNKGLTPLHYAVQKKNLDTLRYLVESGADINYRTMGGFSPFQEAVLKENLDIVRYLVESGADINCITSFGSTPLHYAVLEENLDIVRYLVESGADINYITSVGSTPLHYAVLEENLNIVRYLVESGADVNYKTSSRLTPLHYAVQEENIDILRYLIESGADVNSKDNEAFTPLHYAVPKENLDIVRYLVESGADVNCSTLKKLTPLHYAAKTKNLDIVRYLVESGADINYRTIDGFTPLHYRLRCATV